MLANRAINISIQLPCQRSASLHTQAGQASRPAGVSGKGGAGFIMEGDNNKTKGKDGAVEEGPNPPGKMY